MEKRRFVKASNANEINAKIIAAISALLFEINPEGIGLNFFVGCNLSSFTSIRSLMI